MHLWCDSLKELFSVLTPIYKVSGSRFYRGADDSFTLIQMMNSSWKFSMWCFLEYSTLTHQLRGILRGTFTWINWLHKVPYCLDAKVGQIVLGMFLWCCLESRRMHKSALRQVTMISLSKEELRISRAMEVNLAYGLLTVIVERIQFTVWYQARLTSHLNIELNPYLIVSYWFTFIPTHLIFIW